MSSHLSAETKLPSSVAMPGYDRNDLHPGILHFGLGAFHRAHQGIHTQRALQSEFGPWGIVAVNLRSPEPVEALAAQDGLYSITVRDSDGETSEVVGATVDWLCAATDRERVLTYLASPFIHIVTLTVSEKAYGLHPSTGGLDETHPGIANDLANPDAPVGAVGYLVAGLASRRDKGMRPFTILCCDNLPSNGKVVRRLVLDMAERRDAELAKWIREEVTFPSSMVDRIVPAATDDSRTRAKSLLGVEDMLALDTEPFMQWVIEDAFVSGRPAWEAGGALFVENVEPYEKMKLRLLNGSHTMIAHLGLLKGLECVRDVMAVPEFVAMTKDHMRAAAATLDPVPGIDLDFYMNQLIERFSNRAIAHRNIQIAMDSSQKLPQRIFSPAIEALANGSDGGSFARVVGLWIAALIRFNDCNDPRRDELLNAARTADARDYTASFVAIDGLIPPQLAQSRAWRDLVSREVAAWL
ncbi:mannitol dehydrogenase family protein [Aliirhizobium smilacinae]|uniref:Mannitol dehydrogenase family protein n=1 Tax=Aliirhizobium smilacinae TaxID=1395944 RepID=A0A5C4XKR3_9HYPH|nr:mannitol dehydrogenase family protein [Rhizobium smilacinae]TNM63948.1 mannitol dehydrogenase family protein [Rhizobium smilacinae]